MSMTRVIASLEAMNQFAHEIAVDLKGGEILLLSGELGAGKTTFTQGVAVALGVKEGVTSPTFTIVSEYLVTHHPTITTLVHMDLYRLERAQVAHDALIFEVIDTAKQPFQVTIIEWADRLPQLPMAGQRFEFAHGRTSQERVVTVG